MTGTGLEIVLAPLTEGVDNLAEAKVWPHGSGRISRCLVVPQQHVHVGGMAIPASRVQGCAQAGSDGACVRAAYEEKPQHFGLLTYEARCASRGQREREGESDAR